MADNDINWQEVRRRICAKAETEFEAFTKKPPKKVGRRRLVKGTPEYEEFRRKENLRSKKYREENPDKVHKAFRVWCDKNPEKVKAKKHRNYLSRKRRRMVKAA